MGVPDNLEGLRFACDCVSGRRGGYSEPWAAIAKNKLLPNGTKEEILNLLAREPKTISQLAKELELKPASIHAHVNDMMRSELLRESEEWEKKHPTERYYEPNFPVFRAEECAEFEALCQEMAEQVAEVFTEVIVAPGKAGRMRVFASLPTKEGEQIDNQPDGMCLDSAGNLYVASYGGGDIGNVDFITAEQVPWHNQPHSAALTLPPLSTVWSRSWPYYCSGWMWMKSLTVSPVI